VSKVLFIPVSILGSLAAGIVGKKVFERIWALVDEEEPPGPNHRETSWGKLIASLALQGAIFAAVRGLFDHAARRGFQRLTGSWPGKEEPEPQ
jgi:uncharacterized protein DUF4235